MPNSIKVVGSALGDRFKGKQDAIRTFAAIMGRGDGSNPEVQGRSGYVWVRVGHDEVVQMAYNTRIMPRDDLAIYVGYAPEQPSLLQVLSIRQEAYVDTGQGFIPPVINHAQTHYYGGGDDVYVEWRRIMSFRVGRPQGLWVYIDPGVLHRPAGFQYFPEQAVYLGDHVPLGGALYVLIYLDSGGVARHRVGTAVASVNVLRMEDIPDDWPGEFALAAVRLYFGQTVIGDTPLNPDIVDLRFPPSQAAGYSFPVPHDLLGDRHNATLAAAPVDGDVIVGNVTPEWARLAISIPAANVRNVLGVDNAELRPSWKTALDAVAPTTITAGDAATAGTSLVFSHRDHLHGAPATYPATAHNLLSATHGDTVASAVARGDLVVGVAGPIWDNLALGGAAGSFLTRDANDPLWSGFYLTGTPGLTYDLDAAGGVPGGNDHNVQYNDAGAFGGSDDFLYDGSGIGFGAAIVAYRKFTLSNLVNGVTLNGLYGFDVTVRRTGPAGTNTSNAIYGMSLDASNNATGDHTGEIVGGQFAAQQIVSGNCSKVVGGRFRTICPGTGTVSVGIGGEFSVESNAWGLIDDAYGCKILTPVHEVVNYYGLYIENATGNTIAYSIYSAGGQSYFAGNVGMGIAVPADPLEVRGNFRQSFDAANYWKCIVGAAIGITPWTIPANAAGVLTNNGAGVLSWGAAAAHNLLSASHTDTLAATPPTRGSLIVANVTPVWAEFALAGAAGSFLTRNATDPVWSTGFLAITAGKTLTCANTIGITGTDGAALGLVNNLLVTGGAATTVTLTATNNSGITFTGACVLTIPTAGAVTAALLGTANVFTGINTFTANPEIKKAGASTYLYITGAEADTYDKGMLVRVHRGAAGAEATVASGDVMFNLYAQGHDGTAYKTSAYIQCYVSGAVALNQVPSAIRFYTTTAAGALSSGMILDNAQGLTVVGAFGCNAKAAQTAYASGGALAAYATGAFGLNSDANMSALHAMVVKIRAALVANGIMS